MNHLSEQFIKFGESNGDEGGVLEEKLLVGTGGGAAPGAVSCVLLLVGLGAGATLRGVSCTLLL
ncbi:hypothetical protein PJM48_29115, partial [Mycobacterium kansasii]